MKRVLFILLGLTVAVTVTGLVISFTRPIKWPANVSSLDWRRAVGASDEGEEVAA